MSCPPLFPKETKKGLCVCVYYIYILKIMAKKAIGFSIWMQKISISFKLGSFMGLYKKKPLGSRRPTMALWYLVLFIYLFITFEKEGLMMRLILFRYVHKGESQSDFVTFLKVWHQLVFITEMKL